MEWFSSIFSVVLLPILFTFIVGLAQYAKLNTTLKSLFYFVVLGLVTEVAAHFMSVSFGSKNNMPLGNVYFMLSCLLLGIYFMHLFKGYIHKKYFISLIIIYELYFVINLLFFQSIFEYPALPKAISDIVCFSFAMVFFYKTMVESKLKHLWNEPSIFANLAILIYYSGSLFHSVLFNVVLDNTNEFINFTTYYFYSLNYLFYLLVAIAFWKAGKQQALKG